MNKRFYLNVDAVACSISLSLCLSRMSRQLLDIKFTFTCWWFVCLIVEAGFETLALCRRVCSFDICFPIQSCSRDDVRDESFLFDSPNIQRTLYIHIYEYEKF